MADFLPRASLQFVSTPKESKIPSETFVQKIVRNQYINIK